MSPVETLGVDWQRVAGVDDMDEEEVIGVQAGGQPVALYKIEGEFYATHDICSHEHAHLSEGYLEGCEIECPLHQARFDIRTGKAMCKPATEGIAVYPVKIVGNDVFVQVPESS
jgi:nitrite reductase/ring-hydroxylating ferredoxin subunit